MAQVTSDVPVPEVGHREWLDRLPLNEMEVGQSFTYDRSIGLPVNVSTDLVHLSNRAYYPKRFCSRREKTSDGFVRRVWRVV
jgi:hypothetical protein